MASLKGLLQVLDDAHDTAVRILRIAGDGHEVQVDVDGEPAHEVGEEDHRPRQHGDEEGPLPAGFDDAVQVGGQGSGEGTDPGLDLLPGVGDFRKGHDRSRIEVILPATSAHYRCM